MGDPGLGVQIARADEAALPACFALLPSLAHPESVVLTATDRDGVLLGAGGVLWRGWNQPAGLPAWIEVLPDSRRQGVGRALLRSLAALGAAESDRLWALNPVDEASPAAAFARACGADAAKRHLYFEAQGDAFTAEMAGILDRLRGAGRVPADLTIAPLSAANVEQVKWLIVEQMAAAPPRLEATLARGLAEPPATAPVDRERSCVLTTPDGTVAGALLTRRVPGEDVSEVVCNVVDPRWRRGFANPLLLHAFTAKSLAQGCTRMRFDCDEDVRDTVRLARRSGATQLRVETRFAYATAATPA